MTVIAALRNVRTVNHSVFPSAHTPLSRSKYLLVDASLKLVSLVPVGPTTWRGSVATQPVTVIVKSFMSSSSMGALPAPCYQDVGRVASIQCDRSHTEEE